MAATSSRDSRTFAADMPASREARHFVEAWLRKRTLDAFIGTVTLAVSELAANAVLHTARGFTIDIQYANGCVRIEAVDSAPESTPVASPRSGTAADIMAQSETGRGLLIVASLANRWGMNLETTAKTVWCEFDHSGPPALATEPSMKDNRPTAGSVADLNRLRFIDLPVRAAIASGLDVEDALRDLRLQYEAAREEDADALATLLELAERSVTVRLAGRQAAMLAAQNDKLRFDLTIDVADDALFAAADLSMLLARYAANRRGPSPEIVSFREWLGQEASRQRHGLPPSRCPL